MRYTLLIMTLLCACHVGPAPSPTPVRPSCEQLPLTSVEPVSSLSRAPVRRAFERQGPRYQCCWNRLRERWPGHYSGVVVLDIELQNGQVRAASAEPTDRAMEEPDFLRCLERVTLTLEIPEFRRDPPRPDMPRAHEGFDDYGGPGTVPVPEPAPKRDQTIEIRYPIRFAPPPEENARSHMASTTP